LNPGFWAMRWYHDVASIRQFFSPLAIVHCRIYSLWLNVSDYSTAIWMLLTPTKNNTVPIRKQCFEFLQNVWKINIDHPIYSLKIDSRFFFSRCFLALVPGTKARMLDELHPLLIYIF
jgi:hypothetical protein